MIGFARLEADGLDPLELGPVNGIYVEVLDLGFPTIRSSSSARTDADGEDDETARIGARPVTVSGYVVAVAGFTKTDVLDRLRAFLHPRLRPFLVYVTEEGGAERRIRLRSSEHASPIIRPSSGTFSIGWRGPDGVQELELETVGSAPANPAVEPGISFDFGFPLVFPASSPIGSVAVVNEGNADAYPLIQLFGPCTNPRIENATTDERMLFDLELGEGDYLEIDTRERTIVFDGNPASSSYDDLDFALSSWISLAPGENLLRYYPEAYDEGAEAVIRFRSAWL